MSKTASQYTKVITECRDIFVNKTKDYGTSWRIFRTASLTDQIFIKAQRIRTIQESHVNKIGDSIEGEFQAIINYCVMALIQIQEDKTLPMELSVDVVTALYDRVTREVYELMQNKNHDYGEAWREMRVSSLTDLILVKLIRIKKIEDNDGETIVSEGIAANYSDILNYAVFAIIHLKEMGNEG